MVRTRRIWHCRKLWRPENQIQSVYRIQISTVEMMASQWFQRIWIKLLFISLVRLSYWLTRTVSVFYLVQESSKIWESITRERHFNWEVCSTAATVVMWALCFKRWLRVLHSSISYDPWLELFLVEPQIRALQCWIPCKYLLVLSSITFADVAQLWILCVIGCVSLSNLIWTDPGQVCIISRLQWERPIVNPDDFQFAPKQVVKLTSASLSTQRIFIGWCHVWSPTRPLCSRLLELLSSFLLFLCLIDGICL